MGKNNNLWKKWLIFATIFLLYISPVLGDEKELIIYYESLDNGYEFFADNDGIVPYTVNMWFPKLDNLEISMEEPYQFVVPPGVEDYPLFTATAITESRYSFSYQYRYIKGDALDTVHDDSYNYIFPYGHGTKRSVGQGFNGDFTHHGNSAYAVDFTMPIGTAIYAARGGTVVEVVEKHTIGGPGPEYAKYGNKVTVLHSDGTFGLYVHLKQNGAVVDVGDKVETATLLGYSGNTGRSQGPHLHFEISQATLEGEWKSVPITFEDAFGDIVVPEKGYFYYSNHPGGNGFDIILGRNISADDYAGYSKPAANTEKLEIYAEKIDNTSVLFIKNGYERSYEVTVNLTLTNLSASRENPFTVTVPALTENFMVVLQPEVPGDKWKYSYRYRYVPVR